VLLLDQIAGGLHLCVQGIGGDHAARQGQGVEQGFHRMGDLRGQTPLFAPWRRLSSGRNS